MNHKGKNNKEILENYESDNYHERNMSNLPKKNNWIAKIIAEWLQPFKKDINYILEIGCGDGSQINSLCINLDAKGVGIDPSKLAIKDADKNYGKNIIFKIGTSEKIKEESEYFDKVILGDFLYFVDKSNIYHTVAEADRVLKSGGFLVIVDFDPNFKYISDYKHAAEMTTYKSKSIELFLSTGHYSLVNKLSHSNHGETFDLDFKNRKAVYLLYKETNPYIFIDQTSI